MTQDRAPVKNFRWRQYFVVSIMLAAFVVLMVRAGQLQLIETEYLQAQGDARYQRVVETAAARGMILDRNGEILAVSTPVDSVWAEPNVLLNEGHSWKKLATLLKTSERKLKQIADRNQDREFVYLKRHLPPARANQVLDLGIPGIRLRREYRRYYPTGEVFGQVIGFTNIDDQGQEGIEIAFDHVLAGVPGNAQVLRDRVGHVVEARELLNPAVDGKNLKITLDARIQYLAHRYLSAALRKHRAKSASAVVMDARTGDVLAMVNQPTYNPNNRSDRRGEQFRNRAVTDVFEPGSTLKPFTVAMALQEKLCVPDTRIDTTSGVLKIGGHSIKDTRDYGLLTVSRVVMKSSNVGAAKIARMAKPAQLLDVFADVGFGSTTSSGIPGEVSGYLPRGKIRPIEHATLAFGYGISTTALQLARAYTALANQGLLATPRITATQPGGASRQVLDPEVVKQVKHMLELAVSENGTGYAAQIPRYRIAGKTGTAHKVINGRYADDRYQSLFVGYGPVSSPRLVMVVVVDDPQGKDYYGGKVAAPVFSKVMSGALRLLNVRPDQTLENQSGRKLAQVGDA